MAGLGVGKLINDAGAIGPGLAALVLIGLGIVVSLKFGAHLSAAEFAIPSDYKSMLNSFGVICFGLVGLELASVMVDEFRDPARTLSGAVARSGFISGVLYNASTIN